ncbi:hypothetical protein ACIRG5_00300 [Lentzea sp. NPDC102401]|uniref:hypothetical protein n=1 Tax=Lentzea sp. NPDC102401 TaxID=3364128 RepID=UPI0037FC94E6
MVEMVCRETSAPQTSGEMRGDLAAVNPLAANEITISSLRRPAATIEIRGQAVWQAFTTAPPLKPPVRLRRRAALS